MLDVMLDGFDDDDGIIDDEADGQHETEQRKGIHREPEYREERKGANEGDRHGEQRNERGAPALQEDEDDHDDEDEGLNQRVLDFHHALRHGERGIETDSV